MQTDPSTKQLNMRRWLSALMLMALVFSSLPGTIQAREMETVTAQEEATPLTLGEYVQQEAAEGDLFAYVVYLSEDGDYMISPDDVEAATSFSAAIFDEQGESVYEGPLAMDPIALDAGEYTIEVTALADEDLSFFLLGTIGTMSDDDRSPGRLYAGSVYFETDVSDTRYATLNIPDVGYPQEVLLFFQAREGDSFSISVDGDSVSEYVSSDDADMVRFYSEGGVYGLTVDAWERRSEFTLIVFLAGAPVQLELGGTIEATLASDAKNQLFRLHLDDVYDDVTVTLTPAEGTEADLSMVISDRYEDGNYTTYADSQDDGSLSATTDALLPGDYYVIVTSYDGLDADYTLSAEGVAGAPILSLEWGEPTEGAVEDGGVQYYRLEDVAAGQFVRVTLTSDAEDTDIDLHVGVAQPLDQWSSTATGPNEEVILVAPGDGDYYIQVLSYTGAADYTILADEIAGVGLMEVNRMFAQTIDDDGFIVYGFAVDDPGQLISVLIVSEDAADLDLSVVQFADNGTRVHDLTSASLGSSEIVSQAGAEAGIFEVRVKAYGEGGDFGLLVRVEDPATLLGEPNAGKTDQGSIASGGTVVLRARIFDGFSDPASGWDTDEENGTYGYVDGTYQITVDPGIYRSVLQEDNAYADIRLDADIAFTPEDPTAYAGLVCRSTEDGYFYADISPAGDFVIGQVSGGDVTVLSDWTVNEAIDTTKGAVNALTLGCVGDTISAHANGTLLGSVTVEAVAGGYGFEAGSSKSTTDTVTAIFDNLMVGLP